MSELRERRRKPVTSPQAEQHSDASDTNQLPKLFAVVFFVILALYVQWPTPPLSADAQKWMDDGHYFRFGDHRIFYAYFNSDQSAADEPALLILHGYPTNSYDWKDLITPLKKRFQRILIPDFLGLGLSDKPRGHTYSIKEQATIQELLLQHLNITEVHILAHDYGDTVAQELIARNAEAKLEIHSVCLTNGGIIPSEHHPRPIQKILLLPGVKQLASYIVNKHIFSSRLSAVFGRNTPPSPSYLYDMWTMTVFNRGQFVLSDVLAYIQERHDYEERWVDALQETFIPLHLIYGHLDPVNKPEGFLVKYKELFPRSTISNLEAVGHYPQLEATNDFLDAYEMFMTRVDKM